MLALTGIDIEAYNSGLSGVSLDGKRYFYRNTPAAPTDLYRFADKSEATFSLRVNGQKAAAAVVKGYVRIRRKWQRGDAIELDLPMAVRRVKAHDRVKAGAGRVALRRGPIVYCLEAEDNGGKVIDLSLPSEARITAEHRAWLLGGVTVLRGTAMRNGKPAAFTAVPYYAWDNRNAGEMTVWIPEDKHNIMTTQEL